MELNHNHKRQKFDKNSKNNSAVSSRIPYFDDNCENQNPLRTDDYLSEMGLAVLDTDESTNSSSQSSSRKTNLSSQPSSIPPPSAFSLAAISDNFSILEDSESECNNENSSIANVEDVDDGDDENSIGHFSMLATASSVLQPHSDILTDLLISDSSSNDTQTRPEHLIAKHSLLMQDNTPANLIPVSRLNVFGGTHSSSSTTTSGAFRVLDGNTHHSPSKGRAIRNTSMIKLANTGGAVETIQKHKGRSPLAIVSCNSNSNYNRSPIAAASTSAKKVVDIGDNALFFMYQKIDPRIYTGEDNFGKLSDEVILSVFKWLPKKALMRCSLVSHRFNRVSQDESLWTRLDLAGKVVQPYALGRILMRGVIILRMAQCKILEPIFKIIELPSARFLTKIQYLDLSMAVINTTGLVELFSRCTRLKKLSLEHVPVNDAVCKQLANNKQLEVLNLAMCTGITRYGVRKLTSSLKGLQSLNISWTSLEAADILEFAAHVNENLLRLNIAGCRKTMTDPALEKIVKRCPLLRELDLSDCTLLTSQTIDIVCNLKHLEYLSLSRCYNINVTSYLQINKLPSLAYLDIFGVLSDQALAVVKNSFPDVGINKFIHSAVARPTVGSRRTSIWGIRTRD